MRKDEQELLDLCKHLIEEKLQWAESNEWRQRDFLNLIALIEEASQIRLSLSTLKRLWKADYDGTPQPSTLDALAQFLGFEHWLDFSTTHTRHGASLPPPSKSTKRPYVVVGIIAVAMILIGFNYKYFSPDVSNARPTLSVKNSVPANVPNTVIFNYDFDGIEADSFFIQQSWNQYRKARVHPADSVHTSIYYYPGAHRARLIANSTTLAETVLHIKTDDWIAAARLGMMDNVPVYLNVDRSNWEGSLSVTRAQLTDGPLGLKSNLYLSYYYVNDFEGLDPNQFILRTRLRNDSLLHIPCPKIVLMVLGSYDMHMIPLTSPGCIGDINLKLADQLVRGKNTDLSALGTNVYRWHTLEMHRRGTEAEVWLDGENVYTADGLGEIGEIIGLNANFTGSGSIDFVVLESNGRLIYREDFGGEEPARTSR